MWIFAAFYIQGLRCDGWPTRTGGKDFMGRELYRYRRGGGTDVFLSFRPEHLRLENNTFAA